MLGRAFLFYHQIFHFAGRFLFCREFYLFCRSNFCFAVAFLFCFCRGYFILQWNFYSAVAFCFAVDFLFCRDNFVLSWHLWTTIERYLLCPNAGKCRTENLYGRISRSESVLECTRLKCTKSPCLQYRHQNRFINNILVILLLTLNIFLTYF